MGGLDFGVIVQFINGTGLVGVALLILVTGARGLWVFGWQYRAMEKDRNAYREIALRNSDQADKALDFALAELRKRRGTA